MQTLEITSAGILRQCHDIDGIAGRASYDPRRSEPISGDTGRKPRLSLVASPLPSVVVFQRNAECVPLDGVGVKGIDGAVLCRDIKYISSLSADCDLRKIQRLGVNFTIDD